MSFARTPALVVKETCVYWNDTFIFQNISDSITTLTLTLFQRKRFSGGNDIVLATLVLPLKSLKTNDNNDRWEELYTPDGLLVATKSLRIKILLEQDTIFPVVVYQPLQQLLCTPDQEITYLIADIFHNRISDIARNLLLLWRHSHCDETLLQVLATRTILLEPEAATLFRGNSLTSKIIDAYMKMLGVAYLQTALSKVLKNIFEERHPRELDPNRKGRPDNAKVLLWHVQNIIIAIFKSVEQFPNALQRLFMCLRVNAMLKFPDNPFVAYTSISAFLFLRFFCPAILNPILFNMMPDHPSVTTARSLTLVAKVIQNLANMSDFGQKEI